MKRTAVKICGLTTPDAVNACVKEKTGYAGFIAYAASVRHITPEQAATLIAMIPASIYSVLVTVNASDELLDAYISKIKPAMLQFHGDESPERCATLKARYNLPIIKAFGIAVAEDLLPLQHYATVVDMLLLDTKLPGGASGGTGVTFEWNVLEGFAPPRPWFLSGGIGMHNAASAISTVQPPMLDVSSSLESLPGIKDVNKIRDFLNLIDRV